MLKERLDRFSEKMRFLTLVIRGTIELRNISKQELEATLKRHDFVAPYDPYLSMPLWSITKEKIAALNKECESAKKDHANILSQSPNDLWEKDLSQITADTLV